MSTVTHIPKLPEFGPGTPMVRTGGTGAPPETSPGPYQCRFGPHHEWRTVVPADAPDRCQSPEYAAARFTAWSVIGNARQDVREGELVEVRTATERFVVAIFPRDANTVSVFRTGVKTIRSLERRKRAIEFQDEHYYAPA